MTVPEPSVVERVAAAVADRVAELVADRPPTSAWLTVTDVARLLSVDASFVYEHARDLGGRKIGTGPRAPWRFKLEDLEAACPRADARTAPASVPGRAPRRRRTAQTAVPLLPVRGEPRP